MMVMIDPIAGFLTRIRSANQARHEMPKVPTSDTKKGIAEVLKRKGFVKNVKITEDDRQGIIHVFPRYGQDDERAITNLKRISRPGLRAYVERKDVPKVLNRLGITIIFTSEGLSTDKEACRKNVGREAIVYVW